MIKNIIFDLDNTIIAQKEESILYYKEALSKMSYDENDFLNIYNALGDYENTITESNRFYSREGALEFINNSLNKNYSIKLIDEINTVIGKYWIDVLMPEDTLQYLFSKYNLYVFTNWFEYAQAKRLENVGYLKYFKKVFGSDNFGAKPFKSSYDSVLDFIGASPDECIMIGDSKNNDILGANNAGISAILFDYDGSRDNANIFAPDYRIIKNLKELEKIL